MSARCVRLVKSSPDVASSSGGEPGPTLEAACPDAVTALKPTWHRYGVQHNTDSPALEPAYSARWNAAQRSTGRSS